MGHHHVYVVTVCVYIYIVSYIYVYIVSYIYIFIWVYMVMYTYIYICMYVIIDFYMSVISSSAPQPLSQPQLAPLLDAWLLAVNMAEARPMTNSKGWGRSGPECIGSIPSNRDLRYELLGFIGISWEHKIPSKWRFIAGKRLGVFEPSMFD